jgi:hypothetical protein
MYAEQEAKLTPSDGADEDGFGIGVDLDGDTVLIGAFGDGDGGLHIGSAYVFTRTGSTWSEQDKLLASDGAAYDGFGAGVALDGDTALIGAPRVYASDSSGSAYVFTHTGGTWTQQVKLLPADGDDGDQFGRSVALEGDTAVIGAPDDDDNGEESGSVYVYIRTGSTWTQQAKLHPSGGAAGDQFGRSVALDGDTLVIGTPEEAHYPVRPGSAYVFVRTGSVWTEQAKLIASDGVSWDSFGTSVVVDGDTAIVGADRDDDNGEETGSAYVFTCTGGVWTQQAKLIASDAAGYHFGNSVALDGDTAVIGRYADDDYGETSGSAYVFTRAGGVWSQQAKLLAPDASQWDLFGASVSLVGDTTVIGAPYHYGIDADSGSAFVFRLYDDDVPATGVVGTTALLVALLVAALLISRRRAIRVR